MARPGIDFPGVGAGLVILRDGKLLLCRRRKPPEAGFWNIPGGKVDPMEPAAQAARREAEEEAGLTIGGAVFLGADERIFPADGQHWISMLYLATDVSGEARLMEPDKHERLEWFALDALPEPLSAFAASALALLPSR